MRGFALTSLVAFLPPSFSDAFTGSSGSGGGMPSQNNNDNNNCRSQKEIYGVTGSGWTSPDWNWGSAQGTGHDCAAICRELYLTRQARQELVDGLLNSNDNDNNGADNDRPQSVEEIKLILALEWQRGRWDGSDGGKGGYGEVLSQMAAAQRYEDGSFDECLRRLVEDMADPSRFRRLPGATKEQVQQIEVCISTDNPEEGFRRCSGLVLHAMGFVERGL